MNFNWYPFHSKMGKELCTNLSLSEQRKFNNLAGIYGAVSSGLLAMPVALYVLGKASLIFLLVMVSLFIIFAYLFLQKEKKFFASTEWAKKNNYKKEDIMLFSFKRNKN